MIPKFRKPYHEPTWEDFLNNYLSDCKFTKEEKEENVLCLDKLIDETNKNEIRWNISPDEMLLFYKKNDKKTTLQVEKKEELNEIIKIYTLKIFNDNKKVEIKEPIVSFKHICGGSGFGLSLFDRCPACDGLKTPEKETTLKLEKLYKLALNQIYNNYKKLINLLE